MEMDSNKTLYKNEELLYRDLEFDSDNIELRDILGINNYENPLLRSVNQIEIENQEEPTLDASAKFDVMPVIRIGPPDRKPEAGPLNFQVEINGSDTNKSKFVYSHRLNRIYVCMGHGFSVQLKWDAASQPYPVMFVRATPVFSDDGQAEKRVERCIQHYHDRKNGVSVNESMRKCVLISTRDAGAQDVFYFGEESPDVWYSVVIRFTAPSAHAYQFMCKNSCSSGMNRRATSIIFTLEDHTGVVHGCQRVGARACSAPKRDFRHEELTEPPTGKRPARRPPPAADAVIPSSPSKRIRLDVRQDDDNDRLEQFPQITTTREVIQLTLNYMMNTLEFRRRTHQRANLPTEEIDNSIAQIQRQLRPHKTTEEHKTT